MSLQKLMRFGLLFSSRIAGAAALFGINLLIVRYLGLEALASYAVFVSLISILTVVISGGFTAIAPVFVAEYCERKRPDLIKGFVSKAIKQGSLVLASLGLGMGLLHWPNLKLPVVSDAGGGVAVIVAAGACALLGLNSAVLVGMKKHIAGMIPETFFRPAVFATLTGMLLIAGYITHAGTIMWLYGFSIWFVLGYVWLRDRGLRREFSALPAMQERKRWHRAAPTWMGISILWDFMIDLMLLLTSLLAGSIEIAILHVCFRYRVLAGFGMRTIHTLMLPEITEQTIAGNRSGMRRKVMQVNVASLVYAGFAMLGFAVIGKWLLALFAIEAVVAVPVLLIVSATMVIRAVFGPAPLILAIHNRHNATLKVSLITTILAIAFVFLTFGNLGILAVAIGYTGANLMTSVALWHLAKIETGFDSSIFAGLFGRRTSTRTSVASALR